MIQPLVQDSRSHSTFCVFGFGPLVRAKPRIRQARNLVCELLNLVVHMYKVSAPAVTKRALL
jgi:hypothetical protein